VKRLPAARYTEPFSLVIARLACEGAAARSWRTGSSGLARAHETSRAGA
jgi:hypothetical protein